MAFQTSRIMQALALVCTMSILVASTETKTDADSSRVVGLQTSSTDSFHIIGLQPSTKVIGAYDILTLGVKPRTEGDQIVIAVNGVVMWNIKTRATYEPDPSVAYSMELGSVWSWTQANSLIYGPKFTFDVTFVLRGNGPERLYHATYVWVHGPDCFPTDGSHGTEIHHRAQGHIDIYSKRSIGSWAWLTAWNSRFRYMSKGASGSRLLIHRDPTFYLHIEIYDEQGASVWLGTDNDAPVKIPRSGTYTPLQHSDPFSDSPHLLTFHVFDHGTAVGVFGLTLQNGLLTTVDEPLLGAPVGVSSCSSSIDVRSNPESAPSSLPLQDRQDDFVSGPGTNYDNNGAVANPVFMNIDDMVVSPGTFHELEGNSGNVEVYVTVNPFLTSPGFVFTVMCGGISQNTLRPPIKHVMDSRSATERVEPLTGLVSFVATVTCPPMKMAESNRDTLEVYAAVVAPNCTVVARAAATVPVENVFFNPSAHDLPQRACLSDSRGSQAGCQQATLGISDLVAAAQRAQVRAYEIRLRDLERQWPLLPLPSASSEDTDSDTQMAPKVNHAPPVIAAARYLLNGCASCSTQSDPEFPFNGDSIVAMVTIWFDVARDYRRSAPYVLQGDEGWSVVNGVLRHWHASNTPVSPDVWQRLPREHPTMGSCIVVGSSGALRGSKIGAFIDGHDTIFRINEAPYGAEYAPWVGSSPGVRVLRHSEIAFAPGNRLYMDERGEVLEAFNGTKTMVFINSESLLSSIIEYSTVHDGIDTWLMQPFFRDELAPSMYEALNRRRYPGIATTGLSVVLAATLSCDAVAVVGFDSFDGASIVDHNIVRPDGRLHSYRYYNTQTEGGPTTPNRLHAFDGEYQMLRALDAVGVISLVTID